MATGPEHPGSGLPVTNLANADHSGAANPGLVDAAMDGAAPVDQRFQLAELQSAELLAAKHWLAGDYSADIDHSVADGAEILSARYWRSELLDPRY